jgi:hypothetical protein
MLYRLEGLLALVSVSGNDKEQQRVETHMRKSELRSIIAFLVLIVEFMS